MTFSRARGRAVAVSLFGIVAVFVTSTPAAGHPHIFVDATFEAVAGPDGSLSELRDIWHFDEVFSSSVLLDFDKNNNMTLDPQELQAVARTVREALAKYNYYTNITINGKAVELANPEVIQAAYENQSLVLSFSQKPKQPTALKGLIVFGVYDPTLYTALDFATDADLKTSGPGFLSCKRKIVRPDLKEILAENQAMLTTLFFSDPTGTDYSQLVATRLEVRC